MTAREWKSGDVALVRLGSEYPPEIAVRGSGIFNGRWYVGGPRYGSQHGWSDAAAEVVRPLAVIDPEDREQVARLIRSMDRAWNDGRPRDDMPEATDRMQAALREFANPTPPKPDEPTGLGAVVEDAEGRRWVRSKQVTTVRHWKPAHGGNRLHWSDLPSSVRVLSEGVS